MRILMFPQGSSGDVHPFVGLGIALQERGHEVIVFGNAHFIPIVRNAGLKHIELYSAEEYAQIASDPNLWNPRQSAKAIFTHPMMQDGIRRQYQAIRQYYAPGNTTVVHGTLAIGARIAREVLDLRLITVHLQPLLFASAIRPPRYAGMSFPRWAPAWLLRQLYRLGNWAFVDPMLSKCIEPLRRELGLPPVGGNYMNWWHSPDRILGLFPGWYASIAPDWPTQTRLTGFPRFDERTIRTLDDRVVSFLDQGNPPVVFTFGSAMKFARTQFEVAAEALQQLGRRGVFLTPFAEQIPQHLPETIAHFDYVPLSQILLRSAAIVHHGGIGTTAQALATGVRQLIVPFAHDQPDNAERLRNLGVARELPPRNFTVRNVVREIDELLHDDEVTANVALCQQRFVDDRSLEESCAWIEGHSEQTSSPLIHTAAIGE